jgi:hypothetical protein
MSQFLVLFAFGPMLAGAAPIRIIADDSGLEAPTRISSGTRHILFENHGKEIHEVMFVKLPNGMTAAEYLAQVKAGELFPKGALDFSGAGLTSPGEGTELWLQLEAGEYVLICWHHPRVSVRAISVAASGDPDDTPPKEDGTLKLVDFHFDLSGPVRKGPRVIRIETIKRWYAQDDLEGAPPAIALGVVLDSHDTRRSVWLRKNFVPGRYVLHCAMPMPNDAKSGEHHPTHADAGMVTTFEVAD